MNQDPELITLNLSVEALKLIATLARRGCEKRVYHMGYTQPCTHVNPCLTCKAKRIQRELAVLPAQKRKQ